MILEKIMKNFDLFGMKLTQSYPVHLDWEQNEQVQYGVWGGGLEL